jgi:hypothetical protein
VGTRTFGKSAFMTESGSSSDPAAALEREADRLEHHLEQLGDHITDAQKSAATIREQATPEKATGDWEDTKGTPGQGEDPEGAVGDATAGESTAPASDDAGDDEPAASGDAAARSDSAGDAPGDEATDAPSASGDDSTSDTAPERDDPVGSRMPGHASGGDD